jgi:hypothetical protein
MLKKINILYKISYNFNYSSISFLKLKSKNKVSETKILCIHIFFCKKNEDLIKIRQEEKKFGNKKKRDLNLAFLTLLIF